MPIPNHIGLEVLADMERSNKFWGDVLKASGVDRYEFANWVAQTSQRREKLFEIRQLPHNKGKELSNEE